MKKTISMFLLLMVFVFNVSCVFAESDLTSVVAVDGNITVNCTISQTANKPVLIAVLPQELDADEVTDITAVSVNNAKSKELFDALPIMYVSGVVADNDGVFVHSFILDNTVSTGKYSVIINYIGSDAGAYVLDSFEHVGKTDVLNFVESINDCEMASECIDVIKLDMYGSRENSAKEILRKSSANVGYYKILPDNSEIQKEFCEVLLGYKPSDEFDIGTLISSFNKTCAFIKLRHEDNTLGVIGDYNGEYWNLEIGEESDFSNLTSNEQTKVLGSIKSGGFTDATSLENDFKAKTVVAVFRETETRDDLEALISATGKYADYFVKIRELLDDADLNGYELQNVYNNVLIYDLRTKCEDFDDIKKLFEDSLPEDNAGDGGGSSGSTSGRPAGSAVSSSGGIVLPSANTVDYSTPFVDVQKTDWAYSYIKELYLNKAINGISATKFAPNDFIKRQDFVKILLGVLGIEPSTNASDFADVESNSYYEGFVTAAVEQGLISGIGNELFGTGNNIIREDAAVIMSRVLKKYGKNTSSDNVLFYDEDDIASYAKEAVAHTCGEEIFSGDDKGNFNPKANLTRAEACAILCRLADCLER